MAKSLFQKILIVALLSCGTALATEYFNLDLFPIGFTGLDHTGVNYLPYGDIDWKWTDERLLVDSTGANMFGAYDAHPKYLVRLYPYEADRAGI